MKDEGRSKMTRRLRPQAIDNKRHTLGTGWEVHLVKECTQRYLSQPYFEQRTQDSPQMQTFAAENLVSSKFRDNGCSKLGGQR